MNMNLTSIKSAISKYGKFFIARIYLILILFLLIDILIFSLFFWQFYLNLDTQILDTPSFLRINQTFLQDFSQEYKTRQINFDNALFKTYPDPFIDFR